VKRKVTLRTEEKKAGQKGTHTAGNGVLDETLGANALRTENAQERWHRKILNPYSPVIDTTQRSKTDRGSGEGVQGERTES